MVIYEHRNLVSSAVCQDCNLLVSISECGKWSGVTMYVVHGAYTDGSITIKVHMLQ